MDLVFLGLRQAIVTALAGAGLTGVALAHGIATGASVDPGRSNFAGGNILLVVGGLLGFWGGLRSIRPVHPAHSKRRIWTALAACSMLAFGMAAATTSAITVSASADDFGLSSKIWAVFGVASVVGLIWLSQRFIVRFASAAR